MTLPLPWLQVADHGTVIRFVERPAGVSAALPLPGLVALEASFDGSGVPAYADHWVSNVVDRQGFLDTLNDTLGFTPKVAATRFAGRLGPGGPRAFGVLGGGHSAVASCARWTPCT